MYDSFSLVMISLFGTLISLAILYNIIKAAVKQGTIEAYKVINEKPELTTIETYTQQP